MGRFEKKTDWPDKKAPASASQQEVAGAQKETQVGNMLANALGKKKK